MNVTVANGPGTPREDEILGEWAELELALGKALYSRALEAETAEDMATLARAFQLSARSCRVTLTVRHKLMREQRSEAREAAAHAAKAPPPEIAPQERVRQARRQEELFHAVGRVLWRERDGEDRDIALDMLVRDLHSPHPPGWGAQPLDQHVLEMSARHGLPLSTADKWRDLPPLPDQDNWPEDDDEEGEAGEDDSASRRTSSA